MQPPSFPLTFTSLRSRRNPTSSTGQNAVKEPFTLGYAHSYLLDALAADAGAELVQDALARVDAGDRREIPRGASGAADARSPCAGGGRLS